MIELDGSDEPAWAYLEYQHRHILDKMRGMYQKAADAAKGELRRVARGKGSSA